MDRIRLQAFVGRIGVAEAAKRFGVTTATVRRWQETGKVSPRFVANVQKRLNKSEGTSKGNATKKRLREESAKIGLNFPAPPEQRSGENLTPGQLAPRVHPKVDPRVKKLLGKLRDGWQPIDNERLAGKSKWFDVYANYHDFKGTLPEWRRKVVAEWQASGLRFAMVRVATSTHIPFNPAYTGKLVRKKGHWDAYIVSTKPASTEGDVAHLIDQAFFYSRATDKLPINGSSIEAQAETRHVYVLRIEFCFFDEKEKTPTARERTTQFVPPDRTPPRKPRTRRKRK